jgi:hypothetical protein
MKIITVCLYVLLSVYGNAKENQQLKPLLISPNGVDSIKIGMTKSEVEKITRVNLTPYNFVDSSTLNQDTSLRAHERQYAIERLTCNYKGVELILTFFRYTMRQKSDFKLVSIVPASHNAVVQTKSGIKTGITIDDFVANCKKNNYWYSFENYSMSLATNMQGCFFTDNVHDKTARVLFITFSNGIAKSLGVLNMIGD